MFTQLLTPARFEHPTAQDRIPKAALRIQRALTSTLFLDPNPKEMRDYAYADEHALRGNGSNVSSTLKLLCDRGQKQDILAFVRNLPEQDIADIDFFTTQRNEVMVRLTETFGCRAEIRDGAVPSDGTLCVLAIAAAVLSVAEGSLVVIEEIDNGVRPSRAKILLDAIYEIAKARKLRVLLITHNPALADATPRTAITDVVANYRDVTTGRSMGPRVPPGTYTVKLTRGAEVVETKLTIGLDRRAPYTAADRKVQFDAVMKAHGLFGDMTKLAGRIDAAREAVFVLRCTPCGSETGGSLHGAWQQVGA